MRNISTKSMPIIPSLILFWSTVVGVIRRVSRRVTSCAYRSLIVACWRRTADGVIDVGAVCQCIAAVVLSSALDAAEPCKVTIVERACGWPVPLVELRTTNHVRYVSDNESSPSTIRRS